MVLYKIYLGSPHNVERAREFMSVHFDGFTMYQAIGSWRGQIEHCVVFEIVGKEDIFGIIKATCVQLRNTFDQDCVMLVDQNIGVNFI